MTTGRKRKKPTAKTGKTKKRKESFEPDILDTTWIHPESYQAAEKYVFLILSFSMPFKLVIKVKRTMLS